MSRLDKDRQDNLEAKRKDFAKKCIEHLGYDITFESNTRIEFMYKGELVKLFPYSGWHTGKSIVDGRGIEKLLNQIK